MNCKRCSGIRIRLKTKKQTGREIFFGRFEKENAVISTCIPCEPKNDNYKRLAEYIADANHEGEKVLAAWCAGCMAGDDYRLAVRRLTFRRSIPVQQREKRIICS